MRSRFCKSPALQLAGDAATSGKVHPTFTRDFGSGIPELLLGAATSRWILSLGASGCKDSDNWHDDDLGEKNGDWLAEKKAEDEDDMFLKLGVVKGPTVVELSSWISILEVTDGVWMFSDYRRYHVPCTWNLLEDELWNLRKRVHQSEAAFWISNHSVFQYCRKKQNWMFCTVCLWC